ncbi:MAG: purine-nucleoside phosphorylase [Chloroflexi bacterium]|nr:purine-nucleoside phosphorylase [Chloroflexota bacterium]MCY4246967.1 purine-nucleoside phosphorylase [Chloroflexota bacterium]
MFTSDDFQRAADGILDHLTIQPQIGLVLGSGLGKLADELNPRAVIPYAEIPGWPASTVHGHLGNLVIGGLEGQAVAVMQGRAHFYEGYSLQQVTFPIRVMKALGIHTVILTNAAGGINKAYQVGDLMLLEDHINLPGMVGANPLMGTNDDALGRRFVGLAQAYDRLLREQALRVAAQRGIPLRSGVYCALSGPAFETPAEIRMLRAWGADAVGMSTTHEVLVARHAGLRALAFSGITNRAIDQVDSDLETNHEEVLEAGEVIVPRLSAMLKGVLNNFPT